MTTHDTPEAALAAALFDNVGVLNRWLTVGHRESFESDAKEAAAAILAALDGWTLVPSDKYAAHIVGHMEAEIARLRAALQRIADEDVSETLGWGDGDYRIRDRRVARAALSPAPSVR